MEGVSSMLRIRCALWVVVVMALAAPALADPFQDEWNAGMRALGQAKYEEACAHFSRAEHHSGASIKTRYQLGRCNEERGDHVSAHGYFLDAARLAEIEGNAKQAEVARKRLVDIERHVPIVIIEVAEENRLRGMRVTLAGKEVPVQNWGQPMAVEPGSYPVEISAPGMQTVTLTVTAPGPGQRSQVVVPTLVAGTGPAPAPPPPLVVAPAPVPQVPDQVEMKRKSPALFWTGLGMIIGGGVAGLIGGALYGISGEEEPPPESIGLWIGGLALLTTGITFMAVFGKKVPVEEPPAEEKSQALRIEPLLGPTGGGLRVRF
jgi:hypothetical protein